MNSKITNPVRLQFNPSDLEDKVKKIFKDDIARTLWMGLKQRHIVDQYFDQNVLDASEYIKKNGLPKSPQELNNIICKIFGCIGSKDNFNIEYCKELLPYLTGEKELKYEVVRK